MKQSRLTLSELIAKYTWETGLALAVLCATIFRLLELGKFAPGLGAAEAQIAIRALAFSKHPSFDLFAEARSFGASLYIALQAVFVRIFGNTLPGIRILPALLGIISVWLVYAWLSNWFSRRVGLIAALLYAVTPWLITATRSGDTAGLVLFYVPLVFWLFTRAFQTGSHWRYGLAGLVLGLSLTNDLPSYMLLLAMAATTVFLAIRRRDFISHVGSGFGLAIAGLLVVVGLTAVTHLGKPGEISQAVMPKLAIADQSASHWLTSITKTFLMFNIHGDDNFSTNVSGMPLLNFFVGLMFVMGILVSISRFSRARYAGLLGLLILFLVPALLSPNAPDARLALVAAPILIALSAIGTSYLLDIWYGTFPVNSAARAMGMLPIVFLLLVTVYQGYKQYFVAWGGSPEVYSVYNEPAHSIATWMNRTSYNGQRFVATDEYSRNVLDYITAGKASYSAVDRADVAKIPADDQPKQIIITSSVTDDALKTLKDRFPKAKLSQHYSEHNDNNELFLVFEVIK